MLTIAAATCLSRHDEVRSAPRIVEFVCLHRLGPHLSLNSIAVSLVRHARQPTDPFLVVLYKVASRLVRYEISVFLVLVKRLPVPTSIPHVFADFTSQCPNARFNIIQRLHSIYSNVFISQNHVALASHENSCCRCHGDVSEWRSLRRILLLWD